MIELRYKKIIFNPGLRQMNEIAIWGCFDKKMYFTGFRLPNVCRYSYKKDMSRFFFIYQEHEDCF